MQRVAVRALGAPRAGGALDAKRLAKAELAHTDIVLQVAHRVGVLVLARRLRLVQQREAVRVQAGAGVNGDGAPLPPIPATPCVLRRPFIHVTTRLTTTKFKAY